MRINIYWPNITILTLLFLLCSSQDEWTPDVDDLTNGTTVEKTEEVTKETGISYRYQVQLELKTNQVDEPLDAIQKRITRLVERAFILAIYKHRKQVPPVDFVATKADYAAKIIRKRVLGELTYIHFVTYANQQLVAGEIVADDLMQLGSADISAELHYPLSKIISNRDLERSSSVKWWLIAAVLGTGAILFVVGWFILFIYFNTCGATRQTPENDDDDDDYLTREQRSQLQKGIIINPNPPWTRGVYDHPLGTPWVDPTPIENQQQQEQQAIGADGGTSSSTLSPKKKEPKYKRSFRTLSEARLERKLRNGEDLEKGSHLKPHTNDINTGTSSNSSITTMTESENDEKQHTKSRSEKQKKKKSTTKIEPMIADKNNIEIEENKRKTTKLSEEESEIMEMEKCNEQHLMDTQLKIVNKKKISTESMKIESDYGSTTNDEDILESPKKKVEKPYQRIERPMTAKKQRTSLFNKADIVQPLETMPRVWSSYTAGDAVASFWKNKSSNICPNPSSPTENGIIEVRSQNNIRA